MSNADRIKADLTVAMNRCTARLDGRGRSGGGAK